MMSALHRAAEPDGRAQERWMAPVTDLSDKRARLFGGSHSPF